MSENYDAIIIGAGVIGACTAFEMAKAGYRTLSIDKTGGAGHGSTSGSCAIIRLYYSNVESCALAYENWFYWKDWAGYLGAPDPRGMIDYRDTGTLVMKCAENGYLERAAELMEAIHAPYEHWSPERIRERFPFFDLKLFGPAKRPEDAGFGEPTGGELPGAIFFPCGGYVTDPALAAQNAEFAAKRHGAEFLYNSEVAGILTENGRAAGVRLSDGRELRAGIVVNIAGPHSSKINRMAGVFDEMNIKTRALRHEVAHVPAPPGFDMGAHGMVTSDSDLATYARPERGDHVLIGSEDPQCDTREWVDPDDWNRDLSEQARVQAMRLAQRYTGLPIPNKVKGVVDLYDVTEDWIPIYDKTALPGFYVAIGTSGNQFKNAPVVGKMMTKLIEECEAGRDHDAEPASFRFENVGMDCSIGFFSRNREINPNSSFSVLG
ncbi:FAD-binding oxidoreductase [Pikeienuella piscinae]|uniref:FAD-binding oxidoreductase n=1 Tax=Pikeienuella piscinae TaxID=2748098 RepID=A0A7L5BW81_9RHOB|nr:FAD-dependent oxidoreductase [Pikeienuella piscinae]QIE54134.1 FAD-binding oxidoreductase [Pikeienuella piscinae]